eukprot:scaffold523189_cov17-Prasinocladus_malaysianus.AAC.1
MRARYTYAAYEVLCRQLKPGVLVYRRVSSCCSRWGGLTMIQSNDHPATLAGDEPMTYEILGVLGF